MELDENVFPQLIMESSQSEQNEQTSLVFSVRGPIPIQLGMWNKENYGTLSSQHSFWPLA